MRKTYRKAALKYHPDKAATACRFCLAPPLGTDSSHSGAEGEPLPVVGMGEEGQPLPYVGVRVEGELLPVAGAGSPSLFHAPASSLTRQAAQCLFFCLSAVRGCTQQAFQAHPACAFLCICTRAGPHTGAGRKRGLTSSG